MPPLKPISRTILIRKLKNTGFSGPYSGAHHQYMEQHDQRIFIPNPHGKDIGAPLLKQIIQQLSISTDEFNNL
jgi:predicted RNA binding protein YcfA (HicA-like mRNA interferase family)